MERLACNLPILITPAEGVPGEWVAHCLSLDLVSQGTSIEHALEAIREAILMMVSDDLEANLDPLDRPDAPVEEWTAWQRVLQSSVPLSRVPQAERGKIGAVATLLRVERPSHPVVDAPHGGLPSLLELASMNVALESLRPN